MPYGEHTVRCFECGTTFTCGDCIETYCKQCRCKKYGHQVIALEFCLRCGKTLTEKEKMEAPE